MREKCRRLAAAPFTPYLTLFCLMLAFSLLVRYCPGDERFYGSIMKDLTDWAALGEMLQRHYHDWSARVTTETLFCIFSTLPVIFWRLLNPCTIVLAARMLAYALGVEKRADCGWLLCMLIYLYQWPYLADAGWIVTSIAYGWTAAFAIAGLFCLASLLRGQRPRPWQWMLCTLALAFGAGMEQSALILAVLYGAGILQLWCMHKSAAGLTGLLLQWVLVIGLLIFALTAPGNTARAESNITSFYLDYPMMQLLEKIESGISGALESRIYARDGVFYLFALLSALAVWEKKGTAFARWLGLLPAVLLLPLNLFRYSAEKIFPQLRFLTEAYQGARYITLANFGQPLQYVPMLLAYGIFALCVLNVFAAFGFHRVSAQVTGLLALGGMSQAALAFTPAVAVSGRRTGIFFSFCIIAACGIIWRALGRPALKRRGGRAAFAIAAALLCGIQTVSLFEMC